MQWQSSLPPHAAFVYSAQRQKPQPSPKDERRSRTCMDREPRTEQQDLNWNAVLGMMALAVLSLVLYGAAIGTYLTLTN
jgi:hypothetical protein